MKTSTNLKFQIPELDDQANVTIIGNALEALDDAAGSALAMNGDASEAQVTFSRASERENIVSKETLATLVGKVSRWFADLRDAAFATIANNDTTTASGYVADARIVKTHGDEIDKHTTQLGGVYIKNVSGKGYYSFSENGDYNPFRLPVGTAVAGDVLAGKTFANSSSDSLTGTMPNNGNLTAEITPTGANTVTYTIPAGYTSGGTITANGSVAYEAAKSDIVTKEFSLSASKADYQTQGRGSTDVALSGYTPVAAAIISISGNIAGTQENRSYNCKLSLSNTTVTIVTGTNAADGYSANCTIVVVYTKN